MDSLCNTHVKLLACDLLSLTPDPNPSSSDPQSTFSRRGRSLSRAEAVGTVTCWNLKPDRFLKFAVDDGTGCIPCILWLNHLSSPYFARRSPPDVRLIAAVAQGFAAEATLGAVVRVRGKITSFRGAVQLTVSDLALERDPNAQTWHWLECLRLARDCYDVVPTRKRRFDVAEVK